MSSSFPSTSGILVLYQSTLFSASKYPHKQRQVDQRYSRNIVQTYSYPAFFFLHARSTRTKPRIAETRLQTFTTVADNDVGVGCGSWLGLGLFPAAADCVLHECAEHSMHG
jgi:hypothetical protein